jgi:F-type H+-transporting ATPase subunit alpha
MRLREILKQGQYVPMDVEKQIVSIFAVTQGFVDNVPVEKIRKFEQELHSFIEARHSQIFAEIAEKKNLDVDLKRKLTEALKEFASQFAAANA